MPRDRLFSDTSKEHVIQFIHQVTNEIRGSSPNYALFIHATFSVFNVVRQSLNFFAIEQKRKAVMLAIFLNLFPVIHVQTKVEDSLFAGEQTNGKSLVANGLNR